MPLACFSASVRPSSQAITYLLPLIPPVSRHNGTYPLQQAMRAAVPAISIPNPSRIVPAIPITNYTPSDITLHNTLGHIEHRRGQQLDVGIPQPSGKKVTCPICITAKARRTARPLPSDVTKRAQHPWQDVSVDLSGKMRRHLLCVLLHTIRVQLFWRKNGRICSTQEPLHSRVPTVRSSFIGRTPPQTMHRQRR
jgi:hypothetical protein